MRYSHERWIKARAIAVQWAREVLASELIVVDTETTGIRAGHEVVSLGVVGKDEGGQPVVLFDSLIRPTRATILKEASAITGITNEMVQDVPTIAHHWPTLEAMLTGKRIVSYNAEFDERLLRQSLAAAGLTFPFRLECAMLTYASFVGDWNDYYGNYRWHKLGVACEQMGIEVVNAHSAAADCLMTYRLIQKMAESEGVA